MSNTDRAVRPAASLVELRLDNTTSATTHGELVLDLPGGRRTVRLLLIGDPDATLQGTQVRIRGPGIWWEPGRFGADGAENLPDTLPALLIGVLGDCTMQDEHYPHAYVEFFEFDRQGPYRRWVIEQSNPEHVERTTTPVPWPAATRADPFALLRAVAEREGSIVLTPRPLSAVGTYLH